MSRTLDIQEVAAALKRAAHRATHGTREERSGRFLPAKAHNSPSAPLRPSKKSKIKRRED